MINYVSKMLWMALLAMMCGFLAACAGVNWNTVGTDLVNLVQQGAVTAGDAYAASNAVNQSLTTNNVTTGKLTVSKVIDAYTAGSAALNTPGLQAAVAALLGDVNQTIADLKAKGATPAATITAVATQNAATVTTIAAMPATGSNP